MIYEIFGCDFDGLYCVGYVICYCKWIFIFVNFFVYIRDFDIWKYFLEILKSGFEWIGKW